MFRMDYLLQFEIACHYEVGTSTLKHVCDIDSVIIKTFLLENVKRL